MALEQTFQLPGLSIKLFGDDHIRESDMEIFTNAFLFVWSRIWPIDKECIANHWKNVIPSMELTESMWGDPEKGEATTEGNGAKIMFRWKTCRLLPDECLQVLIAHEMGHVYQFSSGKDRLNIKTSDVQGFNEFIFKDFPLREYALVELHADEMANRWGFDPDLMRAFLLEYFDWADGEHVRRKKPRNKKRAYNKAKHDRLNSLIDFEKLAKRN